MAKREIKRETIYLPTEDTRYKIRHKPRRKSWTESQTDAKRYSTHIPGAWGQP